MKCFLVRLCSYSGNSLLAANRELARDPEVLQAAELGAGIPDLVTTSDSETVELHHPSEIRRGVQKQQWQSVHMRRMQFPLVPASAVTAYAAQGGSYDAVLVDLRTRL